MKRTVWTLCLVLCLLLSGCGTFLEGEYVWEQSHQFPNSPILSQDVTAADFEQLCSAVSAAVRLGLRQLTVSVMEYDRKSLAQDMERLAGHLLKTDPIIAYAVNAIVCKQGTSSAGPALAVEIRYLREQSEINRIKRAEDLTAAQILIGQSLDNCDSGVVLLIDNYSAIDFEQLVANYAMQWPELVMESPQVVVNIYPDSGKSRVVELKYTYQTSRESLKDMQNQVSPVFASAELYVQGDGSDHVKYTQLYGFLMERFTYRIETSITPTYSLLRHGVGDSRAFANVYAAMCRQAGLSCMVVSGTREGESHYWNILCVDGVYYHLDLLHLSADGVFALYADGEMEGYVWDYSSYPSCGPQPDQTPPNDQEQGFGPQTV